MPFCLFFYAQFVPKNVFKLKKETITGCRKAPVLNSNIKITFVFELLKPPCYHICFSWKEREASLKICQQVTGLKNSINYQIGRAHV